MRKKGRMKRQEAYIGYLFITPNLFGVFVFVLGPVIAGLLISFTEWDLLTKPVWIGLQNYLDLLRDPLVGLSLKNTAYYAVLTIPLGMTVSLLLALLVNIPLPGINIFRTIYFIPVVSSITAVALVWKWLYNPEFGILNYILALFRLPQLAWLNDPKLAMPCVALMSIWHGMGYNMVIFLAGLKAIPKQLYEAARIDGANSWQCFRHITLPLLAPTTFFILVMSIIGSFQVFGQIYVMTNGGPGNTTLVYNYFLYQNAFLWFKMGYASALGYVLFLIIFVLTLINMKILGGRVSYELV